MIPEYSESQPTGCLLVVDDQQANIQVVGGMLGKLGFEIIPALDGATALRRFAARRPDLILLDVIMPDMDGFETCRRLRAEANGADIPIIFLSAADDKNLIVRALEAGGVDYVTKPFNQPELVSRVRTHLVLKAARDRLKRLAEDKDELLGMITHYLQNHLATMSMSSQLLADRAQRSSDEKLRLMAENIRHSSGEMRAFVKALVANASADHGFTIKLENVNLGTAAMSVVNDYVSAALRKDIVLRAEVPETPLHVRADVSGLQQVLDNLISNAVKFSPPGRAIEVTVRRAELAGECEIRDHGPGFTPEDKHRMFGRYARLSARPTASEPSTGLGLNIARTLTLAMAGELTCESAPGQGATFTLRLPLANA